MENFIFCVVATHAPIIVTSSHDFNIDFEKIVIDVKKS